MQQIEIPDWQSRNLVVSYSNCQHNRYQRKSTLKKIQHGKLCRQARHLDDTLSQFQLVVFDWPVDPTALSSVNQTHLPECSTE